MGRAVFLYTEIAGYTVSCLEHLVANYDVELLIVKWPINKEAPFQIPEIAGVRFLDRYSEGEENIIQEINEFRPDVVVCSGWIDKYYLKICKVLKKKIPAVLMFDNYWENTLKQHILTLISPLTLKKFFCISFHANFHATVLPEPKEIVSKRKNS